MTDQLTPDEMREAAKRLRRQKLIPRNEGSPMDRDLRAGADALDRLAAIQEAEEEPTGWFEFGRDVQAILRGEVRDDT